MKNVVAHGRERRGADVRSRVLPPPQNVLLSNVASENMNMSIAAVAIFCYFFSSSVGPFLPASRAQPSRTEANRTEPLATKNANENHDKQFLNPHIPQFWCNKIHFYPSDHVCNRGRERNENHEQQQAVTISFFFPMPIHGSPRSFGFPFFSLSSCFFCFFLFCLLTNSSNISGPAPDPTGE